MTLHIYEDLVQGTPDWHAARRGIVTASVVGKLITPTLKVADNETARGITATLIAERISGWTEPTYMNDDMARGVLHEPIARDAYAEHHRVKVEQVGLMVRDDWGFPIGASPDGLVGEDGGLEVKCPRSKTHIRTIVADEVPAQHIPQIQACMLVSGRKWWSFVSFCAGLPLYTTRVEADPVWHEAIVEAVAAFEMAANEQIEIYSDRSKGLPPTDRIYDELQVA